MQFGRLENVLISVTCIVCALLVLKLVYSLRTIFPWRVNCWFCNNDFWVRFCERNSWTCPKCEQYNGFTKDGDYNKPVVSPNSKENKLQTSKVYPNSPAKNGLCKMCNINQQLKVAQLANFVPMNDKNFDKEIESYRLKLEKAYKLCSPCKKVLQMKFHKEKEMFLGSKLLAARTPEKKAQKKEMQYSKLIKFVNRICSFTATILIILVSMECYINVTKNKQLLITISNTMDVLTEFIERIVEILKMKILLTYPAIREYLIDIPPIFSIKKLTKQLNFNTEGLDNYNIIVQEAVGSIAIMMLFIEYYCNKSKSYILRETAWSLFMITCGVQHSGTVDLTSISFIKLLIIGTILFLNRTKSVKNTRKISTSPKNFKGLANSSLKSMKLEEDTSIETDDDVSLSEFGLRNLSDSSNEAANVLNTSLISGRAFMPRKENNSIWNTPKHNSTFCVNSSLKSPKSVTDILFVEPNRQKIKKKSFPKYQNLDKCSSDSELDDSISSLSIGSPKKPKNNSSMFSLRKFTATPNFVAPTPMSWTRPLISPSKLGHSTSWVAGGYWGSEGERPIFSLHGSRTSSQSSGFESQSSGNHNVLSQPPSREESVCGESDKASVLSDRLQNCSMNNLKGHPSNFSYQNHSYYSRQPSSNVSRQPPSNVSRQTTSNFSRQTNSDFYRQTPSNFSRIGSPVYPQMQYNSHVHIPQYAQQNVTNVFAQQQFVQPDVFKSPGGSGLIKLPQMNSFSSRNAHRPD